MFRVWPIPICSMRANGVLEVISIKQMSWLGAHEVFAITEKIYTTILGAGNMNARAEEEMGWLLQTGPHKYISAACPSSYRGMVLAHFEKTSLTLVDGGR